MCILQTFKSKRKMGILSPAQKAAKQISSSLQTGEIMFNRKEKNLDKELKELKVSRKKIEKVRTEFEELTKGLGNLKERLEIYDESIIDIIEALKEHRIELVIHKEDLRRTEDRLKKLESREVDDDVMFE